MNNFSIDVTQDGNYESSLKASGSQNPAVWLVNSLGGGASDSGVKVNAETALTHGPLYQGVCILSGDQATLPLVLMRRSGELVNEEYKHPAARVLCQTPNDYMTPGCFRELMASRALLWGNACALINRNELTQDPVSLTPLPPDATQPIFDPQGKLYISTRVNEKEYIFNYSDIFHLKGLSSNGYWGVSLCDVARNTIGMGLALTKHGASSFKNGARLNGVISMDGTFRDPEKKAAFRRDWQQLHAGVDNAGKIAILEQGMEWNSLQMSHTDAQWIESKRLDREEVAGLLNLPPHKLGAMVQGTFSNISEMNQSYLQSALQRWLNKWASEAARKLLRPSERENRPHFFKWKTEAFLRGDTLSRATAYEKFIAMRVMSPNEVRKLEDKNPVDGLDVYENPHTTSNAAQPGTLTDAASAEASTVNGQAVRVSDLITRRLFNHELQKVLRAEGAALRKAIANETNYIDWLENYYGEELPARMDALFSLDVIVNYCEKRKQEVLNLCDGDPQTCAARIIDDSREHATRARRLITNEYEATENEIL